MRDEENIRELEQLDIDWMGFIFYSGSPRYVGPKLSYLSKRQKKIGVFVNQDLQYVRDCAVENHLDAIQLHGSESPNYCKELQKEGFDIIKSFGIDIEGKMPTDQLNEYEGSCSFFLFDTKTKQHGGSGKRFNWEMLVHYKGETPFILSGGISSEDAEEIKLFNHPKFAGIDINSRFEIEPANKNIEMIKSFVKQLR